MTHRPPRRRGADPGATGSIPGGWAGSGSCSRSSRRRSPPSFLEAPAIVWLFVLSSLAIIPLAGLIGEATEALADRLGPGIGGLLNATFGNAAELIISLFALFEGLDDVVKASLTGSIIGNLLLVLGASLLAGGFKHPIQRFNRTAAGVGATLMVLAAFGMLIPAIFHRLVRQGMPTSLEHELSLPSASILMLAYILTWSSAWSRTATCSIPRTRPARGRRAEPGSVPSVGDPSCSSPRPSSPG